MRQRMGISVPFESSAKKWSRFLAVVLEAASNALPFVDRWRLQKASGYMQLGLDAYGKQDRSLALNYFQKALQYAPNDPVLCCDIGQVTYEMGNYDLAESCFRQVLRQDYFYLRALKGLGHTLQAVRRFSEAISAYSRFMDLNDKDADVVFNLGVVMFDSGDIAGALKFYAKAAELAPKNPHILLVWAEALYLNGKIDQALENLRRALALNPRDSELYRYLGQALEANDDIEEASKSYLEAIRVDERNALAHLDFSSLLDKTGKHQEATNHALIALRLFKEAGNTTSMGTAYWSLGWIYYHLREFEKSADASKNAVAINPKLLGAQFNLGLALLYLGRQQEATAQYKSGADAMSSAAELKYWAIDDLEEALQGASPPPGGAEILTMLRARHDMLKPSRGKTGSTQNVQA
jgi:tetratricopeptide (TPR) repeat protein